MPRAKGFKSSFTKCYLVPEWMFESLKRCLKDSHDEKTLHDLNKKPTSTLQGLKPENRKRVATADEEIPLPEPKRTKMDNYGNSLIASSPEGNSSLDREDEESAAEDDTIPPVPSVLPTQSFARREVTPATSKQAKKRFEGPDISTFRKCIHCQGFFPDFSSLAMHQKKHHPKSVKSVKSVKSLPKAKTLPKPPPTNDKQKKPRSKSESIAEEKKQPARGKKRQYESEESEDNSDDMFEDNDEDTTRDRSSSKRFANPSTLESDDEEMKEMKPGGDQKGRGKPNPKVSKPLSFRLWF